MAGPATLHEQITNQPDSAEILPCADRALLVPLKRSAEYRMIHPRLSSIQPVDSWQEYEHHFFVFELLKDKDEEKPLPEAPVAVFAMHPTSTSPVSVVVVTPGLNGEEAEVRDLRQSENWYRMPYLW